ncbi:hypothetical protein Trydic_g7265 [Trypoxylus dichotomus]
MPPIFYLCPTNTVCARYPVNCQHCLEDIFNMRRIQGTFGTRDPEEEKRKTREAVLSNILVFSAIIGMIRTAPYVIKHFS